MDMTFLCVKRWAYCIDQGRTNMMHLYVRNIIWLVTLLYLIPVSQYGQLNAEDIYSEAIGTFTGLLTQKDSSTFPILHLKMYYIFQIYMLTYSLWHVRPVDFKRKKGTIALVYDKDPKLLFQNGLRTYIFLVRMVLRITTQR
jgi:hypothetical protein